MPKIIKKSDYVPSRSLTLPTGYQKFSWYTEGSNSNGVYLNDPDRLAASLEADDVNDLYLYVHHEVFLQDNIIKHTRSSPNWEGGVVTYATCKHLMRTYSRPEVTDSGTPLWEGVWLSGLAPMPMDNTVMFAGKISKQFLSNPDLSRHLKQHHPIAYRTKQADTNPRGDLYSFTDDNFYNRTKHVYDHKLFNEPHGHTRTVEFYKKSPGSVSTRPDGKIPKWWRDHEYKAKTGRRPLLFILDPVFIFSRPMVWTKYVPKRATLRLDNHIFKESIVTTTDLETE